MTSIRTRLLFWLLIPLLMVAAIVSLETFTSARKISNDLNDRTLLAATLTILENVISSEGTLLADDTLETLTENLGDQFFYHVTGPGGAFVTGYSGYPRAPEETQTGIGDPLFFDSTHRGQPVRVVQLKQDLTGRALTGITTITTWQRTTKRAELTFSLFARSLARLVMLVLAAGAIVWFAVSRGLNPLISLQEAIDRRTPQDLNPIRRSMPKELQGIVASMNELFKRVARSKKNRERFIGDAAHQLRNPVAAIKVQAETALDAKSLPSAQAGLKQILDVANHSTDMINKMLSGATAHAMDKEAEGYHNLVQLVEKATLDLVNTAFDRGQEISFSQAQDEILCQCNPVLIREAVSNLIANAITHNDRGTAIAVQVVTCEDAVEIEVSDTGAPFTDEAFLALTQPFVTNDQASSGSGLGLSIANDIARSHGGYLATQPLTEGGKKISIILPTT